MTRGRALVPNVLDAAAAASSGIGVLFIALRLKPVPSIVSHFLVTDATAYGWALLLILGATAATVGAATRTFNRGRRQQWSFLLELLGWPTIGSAAFIFGWATLHAFGFVSGLLTLGFVGFVIFTAAGNSWELLVALRKAAHDPSPTTKG